MHYRDALGDFTCTPHTIDGVPRDVWSRGGGPGIVVMHEVPGLHPLVISFARELTDRGFTVWMPDLFGVAGKPFGFPYMGASLVRACISREFTTWRTGQNSPITDWLRGLARRLAESTGGPVGAVGMCLTGGFALAMMVDECVAAPVLSQPSLPFAVFPWQRRDLGVDAPTLEQIKARSSEGICVLGLRYSADFMVPGARFDTLRRELGDRFEAVEIPGWLPWRHSVLAIDRHEPSVRRTIAFFEEHLGGRADRQ